MLTDSEFNQFRRDFNESINRIEKEYNIKLNLGRITYDKVSFSARLTGVLLEKGKDSEQILFEKNCTKFGLKPEHYNRRFSYESNEYIIAGINIRSKKFPIVGIRLNDGARYRFSKSTVLNNMIP